MWKRLVSMESNAFARMRGQEEEDVEKESKRSVALREKREESKKEKEYRILDTSDIPPEDIKEGLLRAILDTPPPESCPRVNIVTSELDGWSAMGVTKWKSENGKCVQRETHLIRFRRVNNNKNNKKEGFGETFRNNKFIIIMLILLLFFVWRGRGLF